MEGGSVRWRSTQGEVNRSGRRDGIGGGEDRKEKWDKGGKEGWRERVR